MKKITLNLLSILFTIVLLNAQNTSKQNAEKYLSLKGELTFIFTITDDAELESLTRELSIVHFDPETNIVKAWANEKQFRNFETRNIPYQVPKNENEVDENLIYDVRPLHERSTTATNLTFPLATYPTYNEYEQQMQLFETTYPNLVDYFSIGATTEGDKEILFVKISDNVGTDEQEPKLLYTSSMHGDEIAGYPMMLSLIDYILTVYNNTGHTDHARIKNLVENAEIWINPNANPDGTYYLSGDNTSVTNARRGNANDLDLNRNYPDNVDGPHPDGEAYQTETLAFMALADANHFVISANFHGGIELVNYPFDNAYASTTTYHPEDPGYNGPYYTHPDTDWYEFISVEYATHAQTDSDTLGDLTYMTVDYDSYIYPSPGVTHGAEWYRVYGGRQDYMNFYHQCREVTIELSDDKTILESELVDYWLYNKDALLDYLTQGTYGFRGVVKDASTGNPIENATITIVGHDNYGSHTITDVNFGDFYRPIKAGTYNILIEAPCYSPETLNGESISDYTINDLGDILLTPNVAVPTSLTATNIQSTSADLSWSGGSASYDLRYRINGAVSWTTVTG
ncbi:MAG: hypothetical protein HKO92_09550, partial [Flavobacteriaceae bacterium]|nr:hypothetical protein [Flavobacteriaceae bacterium]